MKLNSIGPILLIVMAVSIMKPVPTRASSCDTDTISTISESGEIVIMQSGSVWQVDDSSAFSGDEGDDVVVCATSNSKVYRIVDTSNGDEAYGFRLK